MAMCPSDALASQRPTRIASKPGKPEEESKDIPYNVIRERIVANTLFSDFKAPKP